MKPVKWTLLALCLALMLTGFMVTAAQDATASLAGTHWQLVSYGKTGEETPVIENSDVTLAFDDNGHVSGSGGCNGYGGSYTTNADAITVSEVISTKIFCEGTSDQENAYFAALGTAERYEMTGDTLTIWYDGGANQLNFTVSQGSLVGVEWQLVSFGDSGQETPVVDGSTITLTLDDTGHIAGTGGCNGYGGSYSVNEDESTLAMTDVISTLIACADDAVTQQEQAYFAALQVAGRYELPDENTLTIWYEEGAKQMNFVASPASRLMKSQWQLVSYGEAGKETPVAPVGTVTLTFQPEGQVNGSGGCNSYGGTYEVKGDTIVLSEIISTLMACTDDALNQQESAYFAALQSAGRYELSKGNTLTIWYDGGAKQLNFSPTSLVIAG